MARPVLKVGLTGGIASGKSTVARFLSDLGAMVLDADRIAHEAMEPGGVAYDEVVERFGDGILGADDRIDRKSLGNLVFADTTAREALDRIVHPRVREEAERRLRDLGAVGGSRIGIFNAALLVETGAYRDYHRLVVVRCEPGTQIRRLIERDSLTESAAVARIEAQAPVAAKLAVADYVIDTDTSLDQTRRRTAEVYRGLLQDHDAEFGSLNPEF